MPSWNILKTFLVLGSSLSSMLGSMLSSGWKVLVCGTPVSSEQCQENEKARKLEDGTSDADSCDAGKFCPQTQTLRVEKMQQQAKLGPLSINP